MKPNLAGCPFCGDAPEWFEGRVSTASGLDMQQFYRIKCRGKACMAQPMVATYGESSYGSPGEMTDAQARTWCINGWNRRS